MFGRIITLVTLGAAIILGILLQSTDPTTVGPLGILAVFFCLYIIFVGFFTWFVYATGYVLHYVLRLRRAKEPSMQRAYYFATVLGLGPVIGIGMSSVAKLGFYEIILILLFMAIGVFYIVKRT